MKAPSEEEQPGPSTRLAYMTYRSLESISTSVGPEYNIIFIRITPTLKEVEEQMSSFNINIPSVRSGYMEIKLQRKLRYSNNSLDSCIAER